jgi:oxygen-independent coproporphyrinogen-3 oxidase
VQHATGPDDASLGVYVHVPFCERVCPYCDFAVVAARALSARDEERYVDALLAELALRRADFAGRRLETLYLGGGTPSLLRPESIARIAGAVRAAFGGEPGGDRPGTPPAAIEFTLEVNPSTLERERLPGFRAAGVTRISLGAQSFDDATLRRLGRAHRASECRDALAAVRAAGFESLSIDLIASAPSQTLAGLDRDLDAALEFEPDHVSVYELTIEAGTPFALAHARGQLALPGEDLALALLARAEERLSAAGLPRYEISSYARPGREARHNRRYWQRRPVLGLGVGAVSTEPARAGAPFGSRSANPRALGDYLARVESGRPACSEPEILDAATARAEAVFLSLRQCRGLDAARFAAEFGAAPRAFFACAIESFARSGLLRESADGGLALTARGRLLADTVFAEFV